MRLLDAPVLVIGMLIHIRFLYGQSMDIPGHILASLRNATTFAELEQRLKLAPSSRNPTLQYPGSITRSGESVAVIDEPKQSRDSCKIVNICVPLPVPEYTGILLFPKCIELPQCLGGCCDNGNDCHAAQVEPVRVKYKRWRIVDDTGQGAFEFMEENLADMTRHKNCGCTQCPNKPVCNERQELVNCKCQCLNGEDQSRCQGDNYRWSDEKCECKCTQTSCSSGMHFNEHTCSCEHVRSFDDVETAEHSFDNDYLGEEDQFGQQDDHVSQSVSTTRIYRKHVRRPGP